MRDDYKDEIPGAFEDEHEPILEDNSLQVPRLRRRQRSAEPGDKESLKGLIRDIPNFLKLLGRLARDPRVSRVDKGILIATVAYILMPLDLVPDIIPFLGQLDDVYLLALVLDRLLNNAGVDVLLDHWDGDVANLERAISALDKAGSFLPDGIRSLLHQKVR